MSKALCVLYADDTSLAVKKDCADTAKSRMDEINGEAINWFILKELQLNADKTINMLFTSSRVTGGTQNVKFLGIHINLTHLESTLSRNCNKIKQSHVCCQSHQENC